jgi:hypothetical protein
VKPCIKPGSGQSFKDCPECPEMVIAPSGSFTMGSPDGKTLVVPLPGKLAINPYERFAVQLAEPERDAAEGPQHDVQIAKPFVVGRFAVTFAEWDACAADGGCGRYRPSDEGWGRDDRPVINVSWNNAKAYVAWLSMKNGKSYRLLSEAEREYVTRAGTTTPFWWGSTITAEQANYAVYAGGIQGEWRQKTLPVKSFKPNDWGLYQVHGKSTIGSRTAATLTISAPRQTVRPGQRESVNLEAFAAAHGFLFQLFFAQPTETVVIQTTVLTASASASPERSTNQPWQAPQRQRRHCRSAQDHGLSAFDDASPRRLEGDFLHALRLQCNPARHHGASAPRSRPAMRLGGFDGNRFRSPLYY